MNERKKGFVSYQEDIMNLANKEQEIKDSYEKQEEKTKSKKEKQKKSNKKKPKKVKIEKQEEKKYAYEAYEEEEIWNHKEKKTKRRINILFGIIVIMMIMIATDIISVKKYNVGPFFSIPLHTYNDGGTKEYYGLGYKVIKYHQIQGRRDRELGTWSLKYNSDPITIQDVDLAIELSEENGKAYSAYHRKFVRIISTLEKVNEKNHDITMSYKDEGKKYSLTIKCNMVKEQRNLSKLKTGKETTIIGTISNFKKANKKQNNTIYVSDCFAEQ